MQRRGQPPCCQPPAPGPAGGAAAAAAPLTPLDPACGACCCRPNENAPSCCTRDGRCRWPPRPRLRACAPICSGPTCASSPPFTPSCRLPGCTGPCRRQTPPAGRVRCLVFHRRLALPLLLLLLLLIGLLLPAGCRAAIDWSRAARPAAVSCCQLLGGGGGLARLSVGGRAATPAESLPRSCAHACTCSSAGARPPPPPPVHIPGRARAYSTPATPTSPTSPCFAPRRAPVGRAALPATPGRGPAPRSAQAPRDGGLGVGGPAAGRRGRPGGGGTARGARRRRCSARRRRA